MNILKLYTIHDLNDNGNIWVLRGNIVLIASQFDETNNK